MTDEQNTDEQVEETQTEEPSEGYKDESPAEPVEAGAGTVADENPATPAHEVVEETHEQQAENSEQVESD